MESGRVHHGLQARVDLVTASTAVAGHTTPRRTAPILGVGYGYPRRAINAQTERLPAQYLHERPSSD
jgi:putative lipase involved disintegration of autophagic bodies